MVWWHSGLPRGGGRGRRGGGGGAGPGTGGQSGSQDLGGYSEQAAKPKDGENTEPKGLVSEPQEDVQQVRRNAKNTMVASMVILSRDGLLQLARLIHSLVRPL